MGIARKLEDVNQDLARLAEQGKTVGFLTNTENAQRINDLAEDIREVMLDYQVCTPNYSLLPCLTYVPDFIATRYL
jgi:hypothetical protein